MFIKAITRIDLLMNNIDSKAIAAQVEFRRRDFLIIFIYPNLCRPPLTPRKLSNMY